MPWRDGKFYRVGVDKDGHQKRYSSTIFDVVRGINADPDLIATQKKAAILALNGLPTKERQMLIDKMYTKAYGTTVNYTTPLARFIQEILAKRN